jgi:hypothetical protein
MNNDDCNSDSDSEDRSAARKIVGAFVRGEEWAKTEIACIAGAVIFPDHLNRYAEDAAQNWLARIHACPLLLANYKEFGSLAAFIGVSVRNEAKSMRRSEVRRELLCGSKYQMCNQRRGIRAASAATPPRMMFGDDMRNLVCEALMEHFSTGKIGRPRGLLTACREGLIEDAFALRALFACLRDGFNPEHRIVLPQACHKLLDEVRSHRRPMHQVRTDANAAIDLIDEIVKRVYEAAKRISQRAQSEVERLIDLHGARWAA